MAKHKKSAPAAKKKSSAKPAKKLKPAKLSKPHKAVKAAKSAKPKKPAKPVAKKVAPVPAKKNQSSDKSSAAKPSAKTTPPIPVKSAVQKAPAKPEATSHGKSRPPTPAAPTGKTTPPISVPKSAAAKPEKSAKANARDLLRSRILGAKKSSKPIAFSLDEVREIAKTAVVKAEAVDAAKPAKAAKAKADLSKLEKPSTPHHIKAASLADILGFNPKKAQKPTNVIDPEDVPEKFRRYYKLLLELRTHLTAGIELHSEETLKRSSKEDSGDLSSYGQHMADAGTDTFDRDFALSLVSSEQEALTEIDAAIKRIHDGSYGICEATQKPIAKDRLLAVPFTRYSAEAQKDIEKNRFRSRSAAGLFGEMGEEGGGGKMADDGGGDE